MEPATMTIADFARYLGISKDTAYRIIKSGKIPYFRAGLGRGRILLNRETVEQYRFASEQKST
ncbi:MULTISPECIES: helix-turn-helix domain-containing protein [Paenibacillus]|uniref:Excisionase family DNA-binding domain-containing protein n=1 Tax=Paenibacillus naphthalenovorans TaxID=162209 RepID=A0A0U2WJB7_9BACL|nr:MULTISPECIES: helix-turn-helix domain-containing protein [Paenibacillus]ALS25354.1 excisionase family DNA-binding domain-containing protein [Paenibacillus naphthalenovorans]MEC0214089.1 helix-turn-helix domain-containing protein [Paenibacillus ehimensis]